MTELVVIGKTVIGRSKHRPVIVRPTQYIFRLPNGYGASVISHKYSWGVELLRLQWVSPADHDEDFDLDHDFQVGYIKSFAELEKLLDEIQALPALPGYEGYRATDEP